MFQTLLFYPGNGANFRGPKIGQIGKYREQGARLIVMLLSHQGTCVKPTSIRHPAKSTATDCSGQPALSLAAAATKGKYFMSTICTGSEKVLSGHLPGHTCWKPELFFFSSDIYFHFEGTQTQEQGESLDQNL